MGPKFAIHKKWNWYLLCELGEYLMARLNVGRGHRWKEFVTPGLGLELEPQNQHA